MVVDVVELVGSSQSDGLAQMRVHHRQGGSAAGVGLAMRQDANTGIELATAVQRHLGRVATRLRQHFQRLAGAQGIGRRARRGGGLLGRLQPARVLGRVAGPAFAQGQLPLGVGLAVRAAQAGLGGCQRCIPADGGAVAGLQGWCTMWASVPSDAAARAGAASAVSSRPAQALRQLLDTRLAHPRQRHAQQQSR